MMKKERRGLREREAWVMICALAIPWYLLVEEFTELQALWPFCRGAIIWCIVVLATVILVEIRLEARGRYVDSGIDLSWKDISDWRSQKWYKVNLLAAFWCCFWLAVFIAIGVRSWTVVILAGLAANNAYFAVVNKPTDAGTKINVQQGSSD